MRFIDDIRAVMQQVAMGAGPEPSEAGVLDSARWREYLVRVLGRVEQHRGPDTNIDLIAELHARWVHQDRVVRFARVLAGELRDSFGRDASPADIQHRIEVAIARRLGLPDRLATIAESLELDRLSHYAWELTTIPPNGYYVLDPLRYCIEVRALSRSNGRLQITDIGRVLLALTGRDVIRWLLHVENAQSIGPDDDWRLSREHAVALAGTKGWGTWTGPPWTLLRISRFGLLDWQDDSTYHQEPVEHRWRYHLNDSGRPLLEEIAEAAETPFRVLAGALVLDETNRALGTTEHRLAEAISRSASAASLRQARMVAHEVRNALVPVQIALEGLYGEIASASGESLMARYRPRINAGIDRVFRFVEQTLATMSLVADRNDRFDVAAVLRDAQVAAADEIDAEVTLDVHAPLPPVEGARQRFVLAIMNLLRNAAQVASRRAQIHVTANILEDGQRVVVDIDDDGPGVDERFRRRIFDDGFGLRPGGSGHGLAFVREVVEKDLQGSVMCEPGPLGGARFRLIIPVNRRTP